MVEFRLYNSMTHQKEVFKPNVLGEVGMYVCGVTPYAESHIGHARAAVNFDVLFRYLMELDYKVTYVRNFTDVDDKYILKNADAEVANIWKLQIIDGANKSGEDPMTLSNRFCEKYKNDMKDLQCLDPTYQPRVSDHMDQIIDMITQIVDNEHAYVVDGDVFFAVEKFPNYGQLSRQNLEHIRAGERVDVDLRKRNPADFALWKSAKPGEPEWKSPWGPGRPGWHIECSAMSARYLTYKFDIHGGGIDLIFPHHENEIAQSGAACQEACVSYWLHNGHVTKDNEKMSKSLGNFSTIRQITEIYHPLSLRHFLLSAHYRSPLNYSESQLDSASAAVYYIYQTLPECEDALSPFQEEVQKEGTEPNGRTVKIPQAAQVKLRNEFKTKMSDDLNTAPILTGALQDALRSINSFVPDLKKKQQKQKQSSVIQALVETTREVRRVLGILGLLSSDTYSEVLQELKKKALNRAGLTEEDVLLAIEERTSARQKKEYARSDQIREEMERKGIAIMDVGKGSIWRPCVPKEQKQKTPPNEEEQKASPVEQKERPVST